MSEQIESLKTRCLRPIDCSPNFLQQFMDLVLSGGEVPHANLQRGVPMSEILFFTGTKGKLMGVSAIRFANTNYHKHLFEQAGVPEMYNPYSVESCWLSVSPEHRGKGAWSNNRLARIAYLDNRPYHAIHKVTNTAVIVGLENHEYSQVGQDFFSDTSDDKLRLLVCNHDVVFERSKRLRYV